MLEKLLLSASVDHESPAEHGSDQQQPFLKLAAIGQKELKQSSQYYSVVTTGFALSHMRSSNDMSAEYRVLRSLANRLVTESSQYRMNSKYTSTMGNFLLEVLTLRRAFTGIAHLRY